MSSFRGLADLARLSGSESGWQVEVSCPGGLSAIPDSEWDSMVAPGNVPLRHGLLSAWEQCDLAGLRSRPVVARDVETRRPLGALPGYFYDLDLLSVRWPQTTSVMRCLRSAWPRLLLARTYEIGTAVPLSNPVLMAPSQAPDRVAHDLIGEALRAAAAEDASVVLVQNFPSTKGVIADQLRAHGLVPLPIPSTAVVDLQYSSFADYLSSMRASYRRRAHKALERTDELVVEHLSDFSSLASEMTRLWCSNYQRAREVRREKLTPAYFRQASGLDETSALLVRRADGSIAAFALLISDGPMLSFVQCGFEERAGRGEGSYFRLLYEIVRVGIEQGYKLADLGITTLEPKLDVGAVPIPLYAWIKCRNGLLQRLISLVARSSLQDVGPPRPRRVFKQAPRSPEEIIARLTAPR